MRDSVRIRLVLTVGMVVVTWGNNRMVTVAWSGSNRDDGYDETNPYGYEYGHNPYDPFEGESMARRQRLAAGARSTLPVDPRIRRKHFRHKDNDSERPRPMVCLAFLSCCNRLDLLNVTLEGTIRHMEEDEPSWLTYEIAWVDNGSTSTSTEVGVSSILDAYEIDHALPLEDNYGLATGLNLLVENLCTAPYVLLLEEDWLYRDDLVAPPTERRRHAIATSVALLDKSLASFTANNDDDNENNNLDENNDQLVAFDGRLIAGVFLRIDEYKWLQPPLVSEWATTTLTLGNNHNGDEHEHEHDLDTVDVDVDYQVFCGAKDLTQAKQVWGSYTNGAALYSRRALLSVGRAYGEVGELFNYRYCEPTYAARMAQRYCQVALRLDDGDPSSDHDDCLGGQPCTAAFHHIGNGRGTFPSSKRNTRCIGEYWYFYGTANFDRVRRVMNVTQQDVCSDEQIREWLAPSLDHHNNDNNDNNNNNNDNNEMIHKAESLAHQNYVERISRQAFAYDQTKREMLRKEALLLRTLPLDQIRRRPAYAQYTDDDDDDDDNARHRLQQHADRLERLADSAHPMEGIWDTHGAPLHP